MIDLLHGRSTDGLRLEIELFGSSSAGEVLRLPGVTASVSPQTPDRSVFNSVYATDATALAASIDQLTSTYEEAGIRAWTVWIPDGDPQSSDLLDRRGHVLDPGRDRWGSSWMTFATRAGRYLTARC